MQSSESIPQGSFSTQRQLKCVCSIPDGGLCHRHGVQKAAYFVWLCKNEPAYFEAWEKGNGLCQVNHAADRNRKSRKSHGGPGTELKKIIEKWQKRFPWFDLSPRKGCQCEATATWMDRLGPDGCEKKMDILLDKLEAEAKKRKFRVPFRRTVAKMLVKQAIRRARVTPRSGEVHTVSPLGNRHRETDHAGVQHVPGPSYPLLS